MPSEGAAFLMVMTSEILSTLLQASGAAGVSVAFIWYLAKRDRSDREMIDKFNQTINTHITSSSRVMQEISDTNRELKEVIEKLYAQNWKLVKEKNK